MPCCSSPGDVDRLTATSATEVGSREDDAGPSPRDAGVRCRKCQSHIALVAGQAKGITTVLQLRWLKLLAAMTSGQPLLTRTGLKMSSRHCRQGEGHIIGRPASPDGLLLASRTRLLLLVRSHALFHPRDKAASSFPAPSEFVVFRLPAERRQVQRVPLSCPTCPPPLKAK